MTPRRRCRASRRFSTAPSRRACFQARWSKSAAPTARSPRSSPARRPTTPRQPPVDARHDLRPRLADEGAVDRGADGRRARRPAACGSTTASGTGSPAWTGDDRQAVTIQDLLEHASGLPGASPVLRVATRPRRPSSWRSARSRSPTLPRTQSIYSDPGFMLLGFALENAAARRSIGSSMRGAIASWARMSSCAIGPAAEWRERIAPTEDTPLGEERARRGARRKHRGARRRRRARGLVRHRRRGRRVRAVVDALTRAARSSPRRSTVPGSSRALGVGHHAADLVVRHEAVAERDRPHRFHRHVAVDRCRERSLCRDPVESRAPDSATAKGSRTCAAPYTTRSLLTWRPLARRTLLGL